MEDSGFDRALVGAAMELAGARGWRSVSVASAARHAGLDLARARSRFPHRVSILLRLGRMADELALTGVDPSDPVRDQLFDMLMRRIDALQAHRAGVLSVFDAAPFELGSGMLLTSATRNSMRWLLDAAGIEVVGLRGELRAAGLMAVWLATLRAWRGDPTEDMAATMAALDSALNRAERAEGWLSGSGQRSAAPDSEPPDPDAAPPEPPDASFVDT